MLFFESSFALNTALAGFFNFQKMPNSNSHPLYRRKITQSDHPVPDPTTFSAMAYSSVGNTMVDNCFPTGLHFYFKSRVT
jgi:hypothetical protein